MSTDQTRTPDPDQAEQEQVDQEHAEQRAGARAYAEQVVADATGSNEDLTIEQIRMAVAGLTSPWTVEQLARAVGEPPDDVLPYLHRLVAGGSIEELGEDPRHEPGTGRPRSTALPRRAPDPATPAPPNLRPAARHQRLHGNWFPTL